MTDFVSSLLLLANLLFAGLALIFSVEVLAGLIPRRARETGDEPRPDVAVLIPAHDEEAGIAATLDSIRAQLRPGDRLVVVADNCADQTAEIARNGGAEVVVRRDEQQRGKGYALNAGIRFLDAGSAAEAPGVVIVLDADCVAHPDAIERLAATALRTGRPVQGSYLLTAPPQAPLRLQVAEFAFIVKNHLRPAGLRALGLPCPLTGSGMAFPWPILRGANLASGHLVEDMELALTLACAGHAPTFCGEARITSSFPQSETGERSQRRRWEQGHLLVAASSLRGLLGLRARTLSAVALSLDVLTPPLTLLVACLCGMAVLTAAWTLHDHRLAPLALALFNVALVTASVAAAWLHSGRAVLPAANLGRVAEYVIKKIGIYPRALLFRTGGSWVRTDRTTADRPLNKERR